MWLRLTLPSAFVGAERICSLLSENSGFDPPAGVAFYPRMKKFVKRVKREVRDAANLGVLTLIGLKLAFHRQRTIGDFTLQPRGSLYPLYGRLGTSDILSFYQIFAAREYHCIDNLNLQGLIIDCGANAGYSTAYLLSRFPDTTALCIEPDPENFAVLRNNTAAFGNRASCVLAAVWPYVCDVCLAPESKGWGRRVREARRDENSDIKAVTMQSLITSRVALLKMDIEGSEQKLFAANNHDWLDAVDNLIIELHGCKAATVFNDAISGRGFVISTSGELTICRRL